MNLPPLPETVHQSQLRRILRADSRLAMSGMPDGSVDLVMTSLQDMDRWDASAREFHEIARRAISASGVDVGTDEDTGIEEIKDQPA